MSIWSQIKKWCSVPEWVTQEQRVHSAGTEGKSNEGAIGEPVRAFLDSLKVNPKRYQLQRVLKLSKEGYPDFTCYHWMKGAGFWELTDKKTGTTFGAYVHEEGSVYQVYSIPFRLNHWELKALWDAFNGKHRVKAKERRDRIRESRWKREREARWAREEQLKKEFVKQFE